MMRDKTVKKSGIEVTRRVRVTIEITMSQDWAECVAHQAEELLNAYVPNKTEEITGSDHGEVKALIEAIDEALRT